MFHSRIDARSAPLPSATHAAFCNCSTCHQARDPIGFNRTRRAVRAQAWAFALVLVGFYGFAIANGRNIAAAFGLGQ